MKIRLVTQQSIEEFIEQNANSLNGFRTWLTLLNSANWEEPSDMKETYKSADLLGNGTNRVIFNIGGNNYRMICKYQFGATQVHLFIKWIGTHSDYTKLCKNNKQYTISTY
jgi:mRNA interferase HigB